MKRCLPAALVVIFVLLLSSAKAQVPIVYYDFESNAARNTTVQNTPELRATTATGLANITVVNTGISSSNSSGTGNGAGYSGSIAGYALGRSGFTTAATSTDASNSLDFFPSDLLQSFDVTGFSNLTVSVDVLRADANAAQNVDIYVSTDPNNGWELATYTSNAVTTTSYTTLHFTLPATMNGTSSLFIKLTGYKAVTSGGILRIDNFTLLADTYEDSNNLTLFNARTHGQGLSSGGSFFPTYGNFTINNDADNYTVVSRSIKFNGTLALTNGNFQAYSTSTTVDTLTFIDSDVPVLLGTGSLGLNGRGNLVFGESGHTGGAAFTIPNDLFSATGIGSLKINRTNSLSLGNQGLTLSVLASPVVTGDLILTAGVFNDNGNTITVGGNISGNGTHTSTSSGKIIMTGSGGKTLPGITYGNLELNNVGGFTLTSSPTINGTLTLTSGALTVGSNTVTFQNGNTPINANGGTLTTTSSSNFVFGTTGNTGGAAYNFSNNNSTFTNTPAIIGSLTINRTNSITFGNQPVTVTGNLGLVAGTFSDNGQLIAVGGNLTGSGTHISTSTGKIQMTGSGATISGLILGNLELNNAGGFSLSGSPTVAGTLILTNGALTVGANTLTVQTADVAISRTSGTITLGSTSNLAFGSSGNIGGAAFTIPDNTFTSAPEFNNFTVNRTNALTLNNQDFTLKGKLALTAGVLSLPANYTFTLRSTSITNTAMVDVVGSGGAVNYASGARFLVERFIPSGKRALRYIAPEVNSGTGTFFDNWQEGGVNNNGYGLQITGKSGTPGVNDATTGFDMTNSGNYGLYDYKVNLSTGNASYIAYTSTKGTNDTLSAYKAYEIQMQGNRTNNLAQDIGAMTSAITLRNRGKIITGTVTYNTAGVSNGANTNTNIRLNSGSATGYTLIGNPYVSPIDWVSIKANAVNNNVQGTFWYFDPTVGTKGAYVTYNNLTGSSNPSGSAVNQYIQPGEGFFIRNNSTTSPIFQIREADKAVSASNLISIFADPVAPLQKFALSVSKKVDTNFVNMDGASIVFSNSFTNTVGPEDAGKITNPNENLAINTNGSILSIDGRKLPVSTDTIRLRITQVDTTGKAEYKLNLDLTTFTQNTLQAYLNDRFGLVKKTALTPGINNSYLFTTTGDTLSYNYRFYITFQSTVLPVSFASVKAYASGTGHNVVEWAAYESNTDKYEVEYSADGIIFNGKAAVKATGGNINSLQNYIWNDYSAVNNVSYYRIKSYDNGGAVQYSNIVVVSGTGNTAHAITVYPNPVLNNQLNVTFNGMEKGKYELVLVDICGKKIKVKSILHNGVNNNYIIALTGISKGNYKLLAGGEKNFKTVITVLVQ